MVVGVSERMTPAEQVAYGESAMEAARAATAEAVQRALLLGLVAAHGPRPDEMQVLKAFSTPTLDGCSLCASHGAPIAVRETTWLSRSVFHKHLRPDPRCLTCDTDWPCAVIVTVRSVLGASSQPMDGRAK